MPYTNTTPGMTPYAIYMDEPEKALRFSTCDYKSKEGVIRGEFSGPLSETAIPFLMRMWEYKTQLIFNFHGIRGGTFCNATIIRLSIYGNIGEIFNFKAIFEAEFYKEMSVPEIQEMMKDKEIDYPGKLISVTSRNKGGLKNLWPGIMPYFLPETIEFSITPIKHPE